jgi:DNA-binding SARP family transcriptional activator
VLTASDEISFNWQSSYWLDLLVFTEQSSTILGQDTDTLSPDDVLSLKHTLQLYTGELLEGLYDDWAIRERERMHHLYLRGLTQLMHHYETQGNYEESLACGRQVLGKEPLREDIHRKMMRLYLHTGQRAQAVQQYEACRAILASELGIPPMEETLALYAQIMPPDESGLLHFGSFAHTRSLAETLQQCRTALQSLNDTRSQLERVIQLMESLVSPKK